MAGTPKTKAAARKIPPTIQFHIPISKRGWDQKGKTSTIRDKSQTMMVATPNAAFFPIFVPLTRAMPTSSPNMPTKAQKKGSVRINIISS